MGLEGQKKGEDSKWSWVIAFSCCFINFLVYGVARLSGMMMVAVLEAFDTNRASASLPFSVSSSVRSLSGLFVGFLGQRFGLRNTIAVGCGLASLGAGLCFFVSDIRWMVFCWGGIFGTGFGLATCLLPLAINQNFNRYRGIASGISYSGSYIGSFVFPSLVVTLLNEYGICGTLLVIAGTFLNGCAVAFLFREPTQKTSGINGSDSSERDVSEKEENQNKLWHQLWKKIKSICRSVQEQRLHTLSNSVYFVSPQPLNIQLCHDSKPCCELISYKDSSTQQMKKGFFDGNRLSGFCDKSIKYYFTERMKKVKYKRKLARIKFSLKTTITARKFFYFPLENVKLLSFRTRKFSFCCIKGVTEINLSQKNNECFDLFHALSNSSLPQTSKNAISEECLVHQENTTTNRTNESEHKRYSYCNDRDTIISPSDQEENNDNGRFYYATDETRFSSSNNDEKFTEQFDIEKTEVPSSSESGRTLKCTLLKDAGKCLFGWSRLYGDPMFVIIAITMSLHTFVVVCMITIIEDFAKDIGIPECQVHYVLMVLSIADLIGSLTLGFITDRGFLSRCNFIILCFFGMSISQICISYARRFKTLLSLVAVYGIFESGVIITFPLLIAHYIPKKKQAVAVASSNVLSSPTVLLVPVVIGYFRDMKGCYSGAFYSLGMTSLSCCCAWLLAGCTFAKCKSDPPAKV